MRLLCEGTLIGSGMTFFAPLALAASTGSLHGGRLPRNDNLSGRIEIDGFDDFPQRMPRGRPA